MDPSSWRAWDGKDYTKTMVSPYTMTPGTEADHVCTVTNLPAGSCIPIKGKKRGCQAAGIVWSTYSDFGIISRLSSHTVPSRSPPPTLSLS